MILIVDARFYFYFYFIFYFYFLFKSILVVSLYLQPGGKDIAVTVHNLDEYLKVSSRTEKYRFPVTLTVF